MQKEQIREQFSLLEEQLERLMSITSFASKKSKKQELDVGEEDLLLARVKKSFDELHEIVREETLKQKSFSAHDFTQKVIKILVQEASQREMNIAVCFRSSGKISIEMVEISMAAILSSFKASFKSFSGMSKIERMKKNLNETFSFYIEINGHSDEFHFRLIDDGADFDSSKEAAVEIESHFSRIRGSLAKCGGWFSRKSFLGYGNQIEFKIPMPRNRQEVIVLNKNEFSAVIPCFFVVESRNDLAEIFNEKNNVIGVLDPEFGIIPFDNLSQIAASSVAIKIGVADFEAWIICDAISERLKIRKYFAGEFLEEASWFTSLGLCQGAGAAASFPLIDGSVLMRFYNRRKKYESI